MIRYALICVDVTHEQVDRLFHYTLPAELEDTLKPGMRVLVPFGRGNNAIPGYITGFSEDSGEIAPEKIKAVQSACENFPILTDETLALAFWMRDKYYTSLASCFRCIQPSGLNISGRLPRTRKKTEPAEEKQKTNANIILNHEQKEAVDSIISAIQQEQPKPVLLHGVTGSGKTEVYLRVIEYILSNDKEAIVLVPEISLTPQTVSVFKERFGDDVAVTHSRLTAGERFHIWKQAMDGKVKVVIGPRSAVFSPFSRLGIIIVDEEHEHTYQSETTPKYDARAVAVKRGVLTGAIVVFGSATPSLESYYRASKGLYTLIKLRERVNKTFPKVHILDMRRELAEGNTSLFGRSFQEAMRQTLNAGQQIILFLNRRGYASFVSCRWCGHVLSCSHCRVNFTYHSSGENLLCHYCGRGIKIPDKCPACQSQYIRFFGTGTQKVEAEMRRLFPETVCLRMDMDTTRGKHGHTDILEAFRQEQAQVLIGTQMIAKGLDFPKVTLVGVVAADISLFTGDFRAGESTFQLLTQVSGRAGRAERLGQVFLQTYNPEHYSLAMAQKGDYESFYAFEITLRKGMVYPPFSHIFLVLFTGPDEKALIKALNKLLAIMRYCNKKSEFEILGITPAFVSKIKKHYRWKLLIKCGDEEPLKKFVLYCMKKLRENDKLEGITAHLTLDPVMME